MEHGKKKIFCKVGIFKQGDVVKQMFQKGSFWILAMQNFQEFMWK